MLRRAIGPAITPAAIWLLSLGAVAPAIAQTGGPVVPVTAVSVVAIVELVVLLAVDEVSVAAVSVLLLFVSLLQA